MMNGKTVQVVARFTAKPEKAEEVRSILRELVGPTRNEEGCTNYQLFQNNADRSDFVFIEEWTSHADLDAHSKTPHLHNALARAVPLLAKKPDISRYSLIE
jgi:quinol monooxygenase YgiN